MKYELNKSEKKLLNKIEEAYYMQPILSLINNRIKKAKDKKSEWKTIFNFLHDFLRNSQKEVEKLLVLRKEDGIIKDIPQARKSVVGNAFSYLIIYTFLQNKIWGNLKKPIFISSETSKIPNFEQISTINIDGETQKPDVDLVIYSLKEDNQLDKCIILSLKTSLRERAGQTYKWKLLMEIASSENSIKEKYNIQYNTGIVPLVCFATVNFYNEINNPQHRGMFKFFDKSFIGKPINTEFINSLSQIIDYVNKSL